MRILRIAVRIFVVMLCTAYLSNQVPLLQREFKIAGSIDWIYRFSFVVAVLVCSSTAILFDFLSVTRTQKVIRLLLVGFFVGSIALAILIFFLSWSFRSIGRNQTEKSKLVRPVWWVDSQSAMHLSDRKSVRAK